MALSRGMMPTFLHAACGNSTKADIPFVKDFAEWDEVRLDIDDQYAPDIIGDIRDRNTWQWKAERHSRSFDGVFCSHALEHLHIYDVPSALSTFHSVITAKGILFTIVPNFQAACRAIAEGKSGTFYESPAGPIFPTDVVFGKQDWTRGNVHQQHRCGFTPEFFRGLIIGTGFVPILFNVDDFNIVCGARKA